MTAQAFTGDPITFVAVERTSGCISFSLNFVVTVMTNEFENSGMNRSSMGFDSILIDSDFFAGHFVVISQG
jgi:hypothetical protein